ncbi:MAG: DUF3108 domain-containing protein, partial [Pseudomonadota bacterium]
EVLVSPLWANEASILNESNLPPEFEASYDIYKGSMRVGKMQVSLKKTQDEVIYQSSTKPVGMAALFLGNQTITDRSTLKLIDDRYHAVEFIHDMPDSDKNRNEYYLFDWENKTASVKYKDRNNELTIPEHTFDNYSAQLLLMRAPKDENATNTFSVISKGRLKEYIYQLEGNEAIDTKVGKFDANKFVRRKDNDKKTTYYGWYAEKLNYIPVKLDKYENGKLDVSMRITDIKWLNQQTVH